MSTKFIASIPSGDSVLSYVYFVSFNYRSCVMCVLNCSHNAWKYVFVCIIFPRTFELYWAWLVHDCAWFCIADKERYLISVFAEQWRLVVSLQNYDVWFCLCRAMMFGSVFAELWRLVHIWTCFCLVHFSLLWPNGNLINCLMLRHFCCAVYDRCVKTWRHAWTTCMTATRGRWQTWTRASRAYSASCGLSRRNSTRNLHRYSLSPAPAHPTVRRTTNY